MVMWHGKGLTLQESAQESSLCGQLNRLGLNIDVNRKTKTPRKILPATEAEDDPRDEAQDKDKQQRLAGQEDPAELLPDAQQGEAGEKRKSTGEGEDPEEGGMKKKVAAGGAGPPDGGDDDDDDEDDVPAESVLPSDDPAPSKGASNESRDASKKDIENEMAMYSELEEREFLLRTTRTEFSSDEYKKVDKYQKTFSPESVYVSLLMQKQYITDIVESTRADRETVNSLGELLKTKKSPVVPPIKYKKVEGVEMPVPPFAKHDYELSISTNYCVSKRLLDPRELAPIDEGNVDPEDIVDMDSQNLHSSVKMGFCVYASEKEMFETGGTKYKFLGGEGTCDVPPELLADKSALRKHRRANLYRYQTNEPPDFGLTAADATREEIPLNKRAHNMEVSSKLLQFQPRSLGYPLFESPFKAKASLDAVRLDEKGLPDLSDASNASRYHTAMRYRFEVMRLWWKLFHHQQNDVMGMIKLFSLRQDGRDVFSDRAFAGSEKVVEGLIDSTRPAMVLAVTELGKTGMLDPGTIYPKYKEAIDEFDKDLNRNLFKPFDDETDPNPPRVRDDSERLFTEPVQVYGSDTWPIVKTGMNGAWLDWVGVSSGIQKRNNQAFSLMEAIFEDDLAVDYDTVFGSPTAKMLEYERRNLSVFEEPAYRRAQFWNNLATIAGDIMESIPFWANAYLCDELVTQTAEQTAAVAARVATLKTQVAIKDAELKSKMETLDAMPTKTSEDLEAKEYQERRVYFARVKRAAKLEELKALETHGASSSVVWRPYSSNFQAERSSDDAKSPQSKSWAQECLHRSILAVYSADWQYDYYSVDKGISSQSQRSYDGMPFSLMEGESASADFFRQWYDEVYSNKGDDGLALPGHLVIMNNLIDRGKPTLTDRPGTVQLQGHVARIMSRTRRFGPRPKPDEPEGPGNLRVALFPPYNYLLETQFDFSGTTPELRAARQNKEASSSNKIMVKLTDEHILPFSYRSPYRYGDAVELRPIDLATSGMNEKRRKKYYQTFGYEEGSPNQQQWIIADVPFLGPPSVLSASRADGGLGWGEFNPDEPSLSYPSAPSEHKAVLATLGSLVLTKHHPRFYKTLQEQPLRSVKDYMRWPIAPVDVEGRTYLSIGPFSDGIEDEDVPEEIAAIDVYRTGTAGRTLRYSSFTLFKWKALPHQKAEKDPDAPDQYGFTGLYRKC